MSHIPNDTFKRLNDHLAKPAVDPTLLRRQREDFDFMLVCASKGNMAMYHLLRDKDIGPPQKLGKGAP